MPTDASRPDPSQQAFVALAAVAALGLALATVVESGVLRSGRPDRDPSPPIRAAAGADTGPPAPEAAAPPADGSGAPSGVEGSAAPLPAEGSAGPAAPAPAAPAPHDAAAPAVAPGAAPGAAPAAPPSPPAPTPASGSGETASGVPSLELALTDDWAPLRTARDGAGCLVRTNRAVVATGTNRREPTGTDGPYTANGEPLYVYLDFANTTGVSQSVTVHWRQQRTGASYLDTIEAGPGSRWRTWAERPLPLDQIGPWTVRILDDERCLIEELSFELVAPQW